MALVHEDGTGVLGAESYGTVADAIVYLDNRAGATNAFTTALIGDQERALRVASEWLDGKFRLRWKGTPIKAPDLMSLDWPRNGVRDENDFAVLATIVPLPVAHAVFEMALRYLENSTGHGTSRLEPDETQGGALVKKLVKVGPITKDVEYAEQSTMQTHYTRVERMLSGLIKPMGAPILS